MQHTLLTQDRMICSSLDRDFLIRPPLCAAHSNHREKESERHVSGNLL